MRYAIVSDVHGNLDSLQRVLAAIGPDDALVSLGDVVGYGPNPNECVAALREIGFDGWAIVELDRVVDAGGSPKASAAANRDYVVGQLGLAL